ncbi:MBL fold metallo-hydrolase [Parasphingorhabdus pacifica]
MLRKVDVRRDRPSFFEDRLVAPLPRFGDIMRLMWTGGSRPSGEDDADLIPVLRAGLPLLSTNDTALTWIGHATYLVRAAGVSVLVDPVWSRRIPGVPRRVTPPGVAFSDMPPVDAILISHNHYDHLDEPTIRRFPRTTQIMAPARLGDWFRRKGFTQVTELDWWESAEVAGLTFDFTPAQHWSRRSLRDTCRTLWGSWVITLPNGRRLYHAGDTGYGPHLADIGSRYPGIEVAMLPIGAYAPRWFMRPVHMDPEEAVRALGDLRAERLASMHWGTFALTREPLVEPLTRLRKAWGDAGLEIDKLWDLAIGESRLLPEG